MWALDEAMSHDLDDTLTGEEDQEHWLEHARKGSPGRIGAI